MNIIKYSNRPFKDVDDMNEGLIRNFNEVVGPDDECYILGDFAMGKKDQATSFAHRLNGKKYLILGNHDLHLIDRYEECGQFEWIKHYHELKHNKQRIILFHYGLRVWNKSHHGSWLLYGHSHGSLPGIGKSFDVGCDCWDWRPISFERVKKEMDKREIYTPDHHGSETNDNF